MKKKGKLIVFEGVSGTGKETQAKLLQNYLLTRGIKSRVVYHPSPELKALLSAWRKERRIDHIAEVYFLLADRSDRVRQIIAPSLAKGEWVISLRSALSAIVYQGKTAKEREWIGKEFARFEPKADCLFWFDITPDVAMQRIMKRHKEKGEALGKFETRQYLIDKRRSYDHVLRTIPHHRLNAADTIDVIHSRIVSIVRTTLPTK